MLEAHPYEEVAHEIIRLENQWSEVGSGLIGEFSEERTETEFLQSIKDKMHAPVIRFTQRKETKGIKKVAVCGGSGSFLLQEAMAQKADVFMSSDFKYHQFFESEGKIMIADIGHYEGEYFTIELLGDLLKEKFPTFAVDLTGIRTNPINYYC
jgi:putative NIF3 family GTP cyclohydrolase 1 type 2